MADKRPLRVGIMGFGQMGRQIYDLASRGDDVEVVAIADVGKPAILHYLLRSEVKDPMRYKLEGNFLVNPRFRARLMQIDRPAEMPWDIFSVDAVIDATGRFRDQSSMEEHLSNGAGRVVLRTLPLDAIDRIVVPTINGEAAKASDRMISAGSPTTTALCLLLHGLSQHVAIQCASMTTIHSFTSDQALQDYAGSDFRRSRSAAKNIIPNTHEASRWIGSVLPAFEDKIMTWALNVPVQEGCLLDVNLVLEDGTVGVEDINSAICAAASHSPGVVDTVEDPIFSSDVIGNPASLVFDLRGTIKAGDHTIKTLSWYETLGHAARLLDLVRLYGHLDQQEAKS